MTYRAALCGGIDRTGCKAACQIAAAVLNAGNAARIIRCGNIGVDVAVLNMADDRAFALLQLAADAACGVRVGQIQALNLTGDNTAGNRTVVDACQRADVLLTGNVAVEQRNILNVRLISLGTTTRPRSSILRTIPVAFIAIPPPIFGISAAIVVVFTEIVQFM